MDIPKNGKEKRIWMHWKSLKWASEEYAPSTPNSVWLLLARTHKMPVREIKDLITRIRGKQ